MPNTAGSPIPNTPPPTGLQSPVPAPVAPLPKPDAPIRVSPSLGQLTGRVPPQPLNISDAVAIALTNNRQLALATAALLRAQGRLSETRAAFNPTVGANFTYTRLSQGQSVNFSSLGTGHDHRRHYNDHHDGNGNRDGGEVTTGGTTAGGTTAGGATTGGTTTGGTTTGGTTTTTGGTTATTGQAIDIVNVDQPVLNASITLPIDIAGLLRGAVQQSQFLEVAQRIDINRARNQIVLDVKSAFYSVLRSQALVTVAQQTLQDNLDRLRDAQQKFTAGTVARFDVIRAQTDVDNARQQLIAAQANVDQYLGQLNNNLGLNIDTPLSITSANAVENPPGVALPNATINPGGTGAAPNGDLPNALPANPITPPEVPVDPNLPTAAQGIGTTNAPVVVTGSAVLGPEYRAVVKEAIANRPEVLEADAEIAAARKGIQLARRSLLPTLGLSLGVQYTPNAAGFSPQTSIGSFVAALTFPLYDGGVSGARVTQARADVATAETNRRTAVDTVNLEVRTAYLSLLQARDQVAVANSSLAQAQEAYRLARVRYTNGVSTLVEVSDAQAALTQSENNQVNALYNYNNARSTLDKAAGRYAYVGNGPGFAAPPPPKVTGSTANGGR